MKIESLIKRKDGTRVTLDAPTRHYHFKPTENEPRHLAEVSEASHIAMLLRIRDGYRAVEGEELPAGDDDNGKKLGERELKGSTVHSPTYTIKGGDTIELDDLVNMAFEDSGLSEDDWNALDDQKRYEFIDTTLGELRDPPDEGGTQTPPPQSDATSTTDTESDDAENGAGDDGAGDDGDGKDEDEAKPLDRDEWAAKYKELYNREPNKRMTAAQIKRAVVEA